MCPERLIYYFIYFPDNVHKNSSDLRGSMCSHVFYFLIILKYILFTYFGRVACGILVPRPGIEPLPTCRVSGGILTTELSGKSTWVCSEWRIQRADSDSKGL